MHGIPPAGWPGGKEPRRALFRHGLVPLVILEKNPLAYESSSSSATAFSIFLFLFFSME